MAGGMDAWVVVTGSRGPRGQSPERGELDRPPFQPPSSLSSPFFFRYRTRPPLPQNLQSASQDEQRNMAAAAQVSADRAS